MVEQIVADITFEIMTGEELYPIIGDALPWECDLSGLMGKFKGLYSVAQCLEKAKITYHHLKNHIDEKDMLIVVGEILLWSKGMIASYNMQFNPPFEFHSWIVYKEDQIIDFSLPGVIIRGLRLCDEIGPYLEGRVPAILAGKPEKWMEYKNVYLFKKEGKLYE